MNRCLTSSGLEHETFQTYVVAEIEQLCHLVRVLTQLVAAGIELYRTRMVLHVSERCLAVGPQGDYSTGDVNWHLPVGAKSCNGIARGVSFGVTVRKRFNTTFP
jgi:hypothetical protein